MLCLLVLFQIICLIECERSSEVILDRTKLYEAISCDPLLNVDEGIKGNLSKAIFQLNAEFIEMNIYVNGAELDSGPNEQVNDTFAVVPYNKWAWVNTDGLQIYQLDYRFELWSLGTLYPSVHLMDFNLTASNPECLNKLGLRDKFNHIYRKFKDALFNNTSHVYYDYVYLCHRYEHHLNNQSSERCLGTTCHVLNSHHEIDSFGFCIENVMGNQIFIWLLIYIIAFNYLPLSSYCLHEEYTFSKGEGKNITESQTTLNVSASKNGWVTMFGIDATNYRHFPLIAKSMFFYFYSNFTWPFIHRAGVIFLCLSFFIWFFVFANYNTTNVKNMLCIT